MKRVIIALIIVALVPSPALGLDATQRTNLIANCSAIKATIAQVRRADTVARITRGRSYEQTSRLLDAMNAHVGYNSLSQPLLTDMTSEFKQSFQSYQASFPRYEASMEAAEKTKCPEQSDQFYAHLVRAREHRRVMAVSVAQAEAALKAYRATIVDIRQQVQAATQTEGQQ